MNNNSKKYLFIFSLVLLSLLNSSLLFAQDWIQLGNDIDGASVQEESGWSVSLNSDGTFLVVGAPYNNETGTLAGEVKVYNYNNAVVHGINVEGILMLLDKKIILVIPFQ